MLGSIGDVDFFEHKVNCINHSLGSHDLDGEVVFDALLPLLK